ncbi:MAG: hypothetical protein ANABAC_3416 [Anaerolineae bacterium]|nr:MAG: hypothetical protein ANABAC_3416 [Anaerolineae bacterium]
MDSASASPPTFPVTLAQLTSSGITPPYDLNSFESQLPEYFFPQD